MSNIVRFTPFQDLDRVFQEDFFMPIVGRMNTPAVDLYENENEVIAEISIPGMDPKNVHVEIENNVLHIKAENEQVVEDKVRDYYRKEVRRGAFSRTLALPTEVDAEKVSATSERGVLRVVMPKSERVKPRKVNIEVKE